MIFNKKVISAITTICFTLTLLSGCNEEKVISTSTIAEAKQKSFSHKRYQSIFNSMVKDLKFKDYNFIEATEENNLTFIEKDFSFGKRAYLTLDGKDSRLETQERLVYQKKDKTTYLIVDVILLNKKLENDMAYWNSRNGKAFQEGSPLRVFDDNLLIVNNLLIQTMVLSTNGKGLLSTESYTVTKVLIDYLEKKKLTK
jgi:hypothetical protein